MDKPIIILGIESSCDDTSAAIIKDGKKISNIIGSQKIHEKYGGVVPELASRAHLQNIIPVVNQAIKESRVKKNQISAVAFTRGPGLLGSLLVGVSFAKSFGLALNIPIIDVNHMHGHILAHFIKENDQKHNPPKFPFLCLTVSGGHTQIIKVNDYLDFDLLGETIDDAAGEAFDKSAKTLGMKYPGGPLIDKYAINGNPHAFKFGIPKVDGLNFSFSGLKTSVAQAWYNSPQNQQTRADIARAFEEAVVETMAIKSRRALQQTGIKQLVVAGGVSANLHLRQKLGELQATDQVAVFFTRHEYCTDNAAMVAYTGYQRLMAGQREGLALQPVARWPLCDLKPPIKD